MTPLTPVTWDRIYFFFHFVKKRICEKIENSLFSMFNFSEKTEKFSGSRGVKSDLHIQWNKVFQNFQFWVSKSKAYQYWHAHAKTMISLLCQTYAGGRWHTFPTSYPKFFRFREFLTKLSQSELPSSDSTFRLIEPNKLSSGFQNPVNPHAVGWHSRISLSFDNFQEQSQKSESVTNLFYVTV